MEFSAKASLTNHLVSIALAVITAAGVGFGFYYNTSYTLTKHESDIDEVRIDVEKMKTTVQNEQINSSVNAAELKNMKESIDRVEKNQLEIIKLLKE